MNWHPMSTAPRNCTHVRLLMSDGTIHENAHWASDFSGEEQPAFEGWFIPMLNTEGKLLGYEEVVGPKGWQPKEDQ